MLRPATKSVKKLLSCMMVVIMMLSVIPFGGLTGIELGIQSTAESSVIEYGNCGEIDANGQFGSNVTYTLYEDGTLIISGKGKMGDFENDGGSHGDELYSDVPYAHYICDGFDYYDNTVRNVIIEEGVTSIGSCAFESFICLENITIPNGIESVGNRAFDFSAWYKNQPDGVIYIGTVAYAYKGQAPENKTVTLKEGTTAISDFAFSGCSEIERIVIPDGVVSIGDSAFEGCFALEEIVLPDSVTSVGDIYSYGGGVFQACRELKSVVLSSAMTSIPPYTFSHCESLESIIIPKNIDSIYCCAFNNCNNLKDIYYVGSEEEWNNIYINQENGSNQELLGATVHFNYQNPYHTHAFTPEITSDATCIDPGVMTYTCICSESYNEPIPAVGHIDADADGSCDVCGDVLETVNNCTHICHKTGFAGFIWKIVLVFCKLFKINQFCECGMKHY